MLVRKYGFVRRAFADALKEEVVERFPQVLDVVAGHVLGSGERERCGDEARRWLVYDLKPPVVRALLQNYGTDVRRRDSGGTYWIDQMEAWVAANAPERLVITDCRFINEVNWVQCEAGGRNARAYAVRVDRPQAPRGPSHASEEEAAAAPWDYTLVNGGDDLESLERAVDAMARDLRIASM